MVTKVIVYSILYGVVYCTTARENINETRVKIKLDRGGRIHKGSFIFVWLLFALRSLHRAQLNLTYEWSLLWMYLLPMKLPGSWSQLVFLWFLLSSLLPKTAFFFSSSFRCLITQMTSLEPEKISTKQYNQIPLTLDSQNKNFFCPIIQWKTKQLEREIVLRLCVRYRASLIFLPCEQLVTLFFGCLEISPYIKLLKQCGSYYGANLLTYLCQSSDQFYFVFPKKKGYC